MSSHRSPGLACRSVVAAIALSGVALTVLATLRVGAAPGAYVGQVEVVVHPPATDWVRNPLATVTGDAVSFAGLITEVATGDREVQRITSQSLTLADQGMRHQTLISLVNLGGQWANDFSRPFIRIEAVDDTAAAVRQRLDDGTAQVQRAIDALQRDAHVRRRNLAVAETVPAVPQVAYEGTHRPRAMLMTLLVGLLLTLALCRAAARRLPTTGWRGSKPQHPTRRLTEEEQFA